MMARLTHSIVLLATLTRGAWGQQDSLILPGDRDASAELAKIVSDVQGAGLPVDPIVGRVRYGVIMHAQPQLIVSTVRALAARLAVARDALEPRPTPDDIASGAVALEFGATKDELRAVRKASSDQPMSPPLGVLAQLVASGISHKRAAQIVTDLIKRHATANQLATLGNDVNADVANGAQAMAALDIRLRGLTAVLAPAGGSSSAADGLMTQSPKVPKKP
jgi:hypothetical protein